MDKYLLFSQMTLEQQMNYVCDKEANKAVERSIQHKVSVKKVTVTWGRCSSFCWGQKAHKRLEQGDKTRGKQRKKAKEFLINECKWTSEQFDEVDWNMLDVTLEKKPDGYKMWLSKQHTGVCGTRLQVSYYKGLKGKQV